MDKGLSPNAIATDDQERKIKGSYNRITYEHNRFVPDQWLKEGTHKSKRVFVIDAKLTGKSIHDRLGSISYWKEWPVSSTEHLLLLMLGIVFVGATIAVVFRIKDILKAIKSSRWKD